MLIFRIFLLVFLFPAVEIGCAQQAPWSLQQCIDSALANNITVHLSDLNNQLSALDVSQARSDRLPDLNLSADQNFNFGNVTDPVSDQASYKTVVTNNFSLSSSLTLFHGYQLQRAIHQEQLNYKAGTLDLQKLKNDLSLSVLDAYVQVLVSYKALQIAEEQVSVSAEEVARTKKYVDAGKFPESNLLLIRSQLATDQLGRVNAANQLQLAKVSLMQLMNIPLSPDFEIRQADIGSLLTPEASAAPEIYQTALAFLPQIKSAQLKTDAALTGLQLAKGAAYPWLTLGGSLRTNYADNNYRLSYTTTYLSEPIGYLQSNPAETVYGPVPQTTVHEGHYSFADQVSDHFNPFLTIGFSVPLISHHEVLNNVAKAKLLIRESGWEQELTKNALRKDIELAVANETAAASTYQAAMAQDSAEAMAFNNMEVKFNNGVVSATDFLLEKNNREKAALNLLLASFDYLYKIKLIDFYLGKTITF